MIRNKINWTERKADITLYFIAAVLTGFFSVLIWALIFTLAESASSWSHDVAIATSMAAIIVLIISIVVFSSFFYAIILSKICNHLMLKRGSKYTK